MAGREEESVLMVRTVVSALNCTWPFLVTSDRRLGYRKKVVAFVLFRLSTSSVIATQHVAPALRLTLRLRTDKSLEPVVLMHGRQGRRVSRPSCYRSVTPPALIPIPSRLCRTYIVVDREGSCCVLAVYAVREGAVSHVPDWQAAPLGHSIGNNCTKQTLCTSAASRFEAWNLLPGRRRPRRSC